VGEESDGSGDDDDDGEDGDPERVGLFGDAARGYTPLYMVEQTDEYVAPPVVGGRVPKNKFGNLDLYVPSMVPRGGVHIRHERAAQAAFILGVDYAPALTGFEFRGRHGTAVLHGVVVPEETGEAVWAVIEGLVDMEAEEEQERRTRRALKMWSRLLKGLRIRERIWAGVDEEAEAEGEEKVEGKGKGKEAVEDDVGMEDVSEDDTGGGGFFVPDEEDDDGGGGGFVVE
jgi:xeroderma pigmentosum group C-complementing protein